MLDKKKGPRDVKSQSMNFPGIIVKPYITIEDQVAQNANPNKSEY